MDTDGRSITITGIQTLISNFGAWTNPVHQTHFSVVLSSQIWQMASWTAILIFLIDQIIAIEFQSYFP